MRHLLHAVAFGVTLAAVSLTAGGNGVGVSAAVGGRSGREDGELLGAAGEVMEALVVFVVFVAVLAVLAAVEEVTRGTDD